MPAKKKTVGGKRKAAPSAAPPDSKEPTPKRSVPSVTATAKGQCTLLDLYKPTNAVEIRTRSLYNALRAMTLGTAFGGVSVADRANCLITQVTDICENGQHIDCKLTLSGDKNKPRMNWIEAWSYLFLYTLMNLTTITQLFTLIVNGGGATDVDMKARHGLYRHTSQQQIAMNIIPRTHVSRKDFGIDTPIELLLRISAEIRTVWDSIIWRLLLALVPDLTRSQRKMYNTTITTILNQLPTDLLLEVVPPSGTRFAMIVACRIREAIKVLAARREYVAALTPCLDESMHTAFHDRRTAGEFRTAAKLRFNKFADCRHLLVTAFETLARDTTPKLLESHFGSLPAVLIPIINDYLFPTSAIDWLFPPLSPISEIVFADGTDAAAVPA